MSRGKLHIRSVSSVAILAALGGFTGAAWADGGAPAPKQVAQYKETLAPQVFVQAQKRKQRAQDVDLDLTVLAAPQLKNAPQIKSTQDAILFIPNAQGQTTEGQTRPRYFIRGIGTNNVNFNAVNPLGTYYDDIYIANVYDQALPLYDLDHVEALEGPQGTLWGKNANAGAINFISKAPTFTPDGYASLGFGSYGEIRSEGAISGAIVPGKLAARLSFFTDKVDGWENNIWNNASYGGSNQTALRFQLLYKPTDDLSVLLNFHTRNYSGDLRGYGFINDLDDGFLHGGTTVPSPYYPTSRPPATAYNQVDIAGPNSNSIDENGGSAKIVWDPGRFSVTSITGYESNTWNEHTGSISAPFGATPFTLTTQDTSFWEFSQELRIASPDKNRLSWLAGLYGFADSQSSTTWTGVFTPNPAQTGAFGSSVLAPNLVYFPWTQDTHSIAAFGNVGYKITPRLKIAAGLRWTVEHTAIESAFGDVPGATKAYYAANPNLFANQFNYTFFPTATVATFNNAQTHRAWTYDVTPEYKIDDNLRIYFRYAHGVLPGNYSFQPYVQQVPGSSPAKFGSLGTVVPFQLKPEILDSYEVGLKTQWFAGRLTANGTIFHYDYSNAATNVPTPVPGIGSSVLFINAGGETVDGGDIEFDARVTHALHVGGNAGWLRAVYGEDSVNKADGIAGQQVPRSPHVTTSLYTTYNEKLPWGDALQWAVDANFRSKFFYYPTSTTQSVVNGAGLLDQQAQNAYWLVNGGVTWYPSAANGASVQVSVQNLFNQHYTVLRLQELNGANAVYNGLPRTFLVTVGYKFL